jgi:hypothetical protein
VVEGSIASAGAGKPVTRLPRGGYKIKQQNELRYNNSVGKIESNQIKTQIKTQIKMTKYTFQTIVATSEVRADFTALREELKSSDKELMTAMFELASKHREELDQLVKDQQDIARGYRERSKELKAAAKVKLKPAAVVKVKKARKAKVVEVVEAVEPAGEWVAAAEVEELAIAE